MSEILNCKDSTSVNYVLKLLECPVCLEIVAPPISQCYNGHLICDTCVKGIQNCPICRDGMPPKQIRNLALEKMIENMEFDCRNHTQGCNIRLKQADFKEHALDCLFESSDYCKLLCLQNIAQCNSRIRKDQIIEHMKNHHDLKGVCGSKAEVVQTMTTFTQSLMWVPVYFNAFNSIFFLTGGYDHNGGTAHWNCIIAGSTTASKEFAVQLTLATNPNLHSPKLKLSWDGPVIGMNDNKSTANKSSFVVARKCLETFNQSQSSNKSEWKIQIVVKKIQGRSGSNTVSDALPSLGSNSIALELPQSSSASGSVHLGVTCDGCHEVNIVGVRYKCAECTDFDLCETCNRKNIHDQHMFFRIARESQRSKAYDLFKRPR